MYAAQATQSFTSKLPSKSLCGLSHLLRQEDLKKHLIDELGCRAFRLDKIYSTRNDDPPNYAVCIPACEEDMFIEATLESLDRSFQRASGHPLTVIIVNNSKDKTWEICKNWAHNTTSCVILVDICFYDHFAGAPMSRRLAMDIAASVISVATILSTDADSLVSKNWLSKNFEHIGLGSHLVCGHVTLNEIELNSLPASVHKCGRFEAEYRDALSELWKKLAPYAPALDCVSAMGASLCIRKDTYLRIGGLPTPTVAEDKLLEIKVRDAGYQVAKPSDVCVVTSCRMNSRASGGLGDALLERSNSADPLCDEGLITVDTLLSLVTFWRSLPDEQFSELLFKKEWIRICATHSPRMRLSQVLQELATSNKLIESFSAPDRNFR